MNGFRRAIASGEFLITAEVAPPKGGDPRSMLRMAQGLKGRVHAVNLTDGSRAVMRMSSLAAAVVLQNHGVETICQMACRDRNRVGLQADLLGASALGVGTILALTGDPIKAGDYPDARAVFDWESVRLLQAIQKLNQGQDWHGKPLPDGPTDLLPGAAVDPQCPSWSGLQRRFERKVAAGAEFFQSQLICDFQRLETFMSKVAAQAGKPILAGIFLLKSAKSARFLNRCVPGVQISDVIIDRLETATDPLQEGMAIAAEQVRLARELCQGVHLMAIKGEEYIPEILDLAEIAPLAVTDSPQMSGGSGSDISKDSSIFDLDSGGS